MEIHKTGQMVRTYECDCNMVLRPEVIMNWIQDAAQEHASLLGFGYEMCLQTNLAWVEIKLSARIHRMPKWKEELIISTWTYPISPLVAAREFVITDSEGNTVIVCNTHWVLIDALKRRPVALQKHLPDLKAPLPDEHPAHPVSDLNDLLIGSKINSFKIERHTVDFNNHVNNSFYLIWVLDSLPEELAGKHIREIRIDFKKESIPGEIIDIQANHSPSHSDFLIISGQEKKAAVRLTWGS